MATFDEVLTQAQTLTEEERNRLAQILLDSLEVDAEPVMEDEQAAQIEETLLERVDGPFLPFDESFAADIKRRGRERLKRSDASD